MYKILMLLKLTSNKEHAPTVKMVHNNYNTTLCKRSKTNSKTSAKTIGIIVKRIQRALAHNNDNNKVKCKSKVCLPIDDLNCVSPRMPLVLRRVINSNSQ